MRTAADDGADQADAAGAHPAARLADQAADGLEYFRQPPRDLWGPAVADFIRDHYGQETVDYLAEPLLSGVYGVRWSG